MNQILELMARDYLWGEVPKLPKEDQEKFNRLFGYDPDKSVQEISEQDVRTVIHNMPTWCLDWAKAFVRSRKAQS